MAKVDLGKMKRAELLKLRDDIDAQLKKLEKRQKAEALAAARQAAKSHGFSLDELVSAGGGRAKAGGKSGSKSPPKYANPADPGQTWTGRGRQPGWIKEALASGKKLEDMAI